MASRRIELSVVMLVMATRLSALAAPVNFSRNFQAYWAPDHISLSEDGEPLRLSLDNTSGSSSTVSGTGDGDGAASNSLSNRVSGLLDQLISLSLLFPVGCGFASKEKYLFGQVGAQIKLVQGDSAGTVTAFYVRHLLLLLLLLFRVNPNRTPFLPKDGVGRREPRRARLRVPWQRHRRALPGPDQRLRQRLRQPGAAAFALVRPHRCLPLLLAALEPLPCQVINQPEDNVISFTEMKLSLSSIKTQLGTSTGSL